MTSTKEDNATTERAADSLTLSSYLHEQCSIITNGNIAVETKLETASVLEPFLGDTDAYISFTGESHQAHLPALTNWNGNSGLRKGYSLLIWVRPRLIIPYDNNETKDENDAVDDNKKEAPQRVLYRFSTSTEDSTGT
jgi:hypothetical protein